MSAFLFIINLLFIGSISLLVWRINKSRVFWVALFFKLSCGILLGLLYKFYYTAGDTWTFFNDGVNVINTLGARPTEFLSFLFTDDISFAENITIDTQPRSLVFLKWVSIFNFIGGNN